MIWVFLRWERNGLVEILLTDNTLKFSHIWSSAHVFGGENGCAPIKLSIFPKQLFQKDAAKVKL